MVLTCDSGATSSLIKHSYAVNIDAQILPTKHTAVQADGKACLKAIGEIHLSLSRGTMKFKLQAVVVQDLGCDLLVGMPFMKENDIVLDIPSDKIIIAGKHSIPYSPSQSSQHSRVYV